MILKNKNILITGTGKGIGFSAVENCIKEDAFVYALVKSKKDIKKFLNKKNQKTTKNKIFKNIFLDKKRINIFPRSITLNKICQPKIIEMRDNKKIVETIEKIVF